MSSISGLTLARTSIPAADEDSASSETQIQPPPLLQSAPTRGHTDPVGFGQHFAARFRRDAPPDTPMPRKLTTLQLIESVFPEVLGYLHAGYSYEAMAAHFTGLGSPFDRAL
jgi:hypothetical protein